MTRLKCMLITLTAWGSLGLAWATPTLPNADFEQPEVSDTVAIEAFGYIPEWAYFNSSGTLQDAPSGLTRKVARGQRQSLWLGVPEGARPGYYQGYACQFDGKLPAGTDVAFAAYVRSDEDRPLAGGVSARVCMAFMRGDTEISRTERVISPRELSALRWRLFTVYGTSPEGADGVVFSVVLLIPEGAVEAASGRCYVDTVEARIEQ